MIWTTTPPTVAGWYWFRRTPEAAAECVEVLDPEPGDRDPEMRVQVAGRDDWYGIRDRHFNPTVGQWGSAPIERPDETVKLFADQPFVVAEFSHYEERDGETLIVAQHVVGPYLAVFLDNDNTLRALDAEVWAGVQSRAIIATRDAAGWWTVNGLEGMLFDEVMIRTTFGNENDEPRDEP